ncbi:MAG: RimK family alpha-L-glutamate ligase [Candidatus Helarchaeota archaeon]
MQLTIIVNRIGWEEKQLITEANRKGVKVNTLFNKDAFFNLENEVKVTRDPNNLFKYFDKEDIKINNRIETQVKDIFPQNQSAKTDIFLQRSLSYYRGLYSTAILENKGYPVVNSYKTSRICGDKLITTLVLVKAGIPVPKTYVAFTKESALEALEVIGYPAIVKPIIGSWGRLVALLKDRETAMAVLEDRETLGQLYQKIFYLQEYVKKPARDRKQFLDRGSVARDIRVFVIGDEVVEAMNRYDIPGDWRSAATRGAKAETCKITPEIEELSLKAAKVVEGEVLGIDLMENEHNQLLVQEINHSPGFKAISHSTGRNIAGRIIDYLIKKHKK